MVNRIIRDDPGKGTMHNRQPVSLELIWKSFKDVDLWYVSLRFVIKLASLEKLTKAPHKAIVYPRAGF
jgi:hypothetical protein